MSTDDLDRGERIVFTAHSLIDAAKEILLFEGTDIEALTDESLATLMMALYLSARSAGRTYEQLEPLLKRTFTDTKKAEVNSKGGSS